jgi:hypothetical protein
MSISLFADKLNDWLQACKQLKRISVLDNAGQQCENVAGYVENFILG